MATGPEGAHCDVTAAAYRPLGGDIFNRDWTIVTSQQPFRSVRPDWSRSPAGAHVTGASPPPPPEAQPRPVPSRRFFVCFVVAVFFSFRFSDGAAFRSNWVACEAKLGHVRRRRNGDVSRWRRLSGYAIRIASHLIAGL